MFRKFKPGVSLRTHHIVAASIWSGVGLMLLFRGGLYLIETRSQWVLVLAVVIGTLKSLFILDKSARKNLERISVKKDGACLGGVYSVKMWVMILAMIIMGKLLRSSGLPAELIGGLYAAIGWALLFSSRLLWVYVKKFSACGN
nr:hypothetical protein [Desulfobulbaceae bacterium]